MSEAQEVKPQGSEVKIGSVTESQIRKQIRQISFRIFQKEAEKKLKVVPGNCKYNHRQMINKKTNLVSDPDEATLGICVRSCVQDGTFKSAKWDGRICDKVEDMCEFYEPRFTKEQIKEEVEAKLSDLDVVASKHKDLVALRWVLGEAEKPFKFEENLGWWERVKLFTVPTGLGLVWRLFKNYRDRREIDKVISATSIDESKDQEPILFK